MADKCTLHRTKLRAFENWMVDRGWKINRPQSMPPYQVLRAFKQRDGAGPKRWVIVYDRDRGDHLSLRQCDSSLVRNFINETRT